MRQVRTGNVEVNSPNILNQFCHQTSVGEQLARETGRRETACMQHRHSAQPRPLLATDQAWLQSAASRCSRPRVSCTGGSALSDLHKKHAAQLMHQYAAVHQWQNSLCACDDATAWMAGTSSLPPWIIVAALQRSRCHRPGHYGQNLLSRVQQSPAATIVISAAVFIHFF